MRSTVGIVSICIVSGGSMIESQAQAQAAPEDAARPGPARVDPADADTGHAAPTAVQRAPLLDERVVDRKAHRHSEHSDLPGGIAGGHQPTRPGGSGSLLKAALAAQADPAKAKISEVSWTAVPEPEPKTLKKHDLVTIIVREESAFSSKGTNEFKKDGTLDAGLDAWIQLIPRNLEIEGGALGPNSPQVKLHGKRDFKGEGTVDRQDKFTARIQAEIVDVKPNGTLIVQARKRIKTDEEEQQFILTGVCRVEDITADNSVLSSQLFDMELQKNHKGDVRAATKRGIIPKLLDFLNPF